MHKYPSYGGIERVTTYLANYLVKRNCGIDIYSFEGVDHDLLLSSIDTRISYTAAVNSENLLCNTNYEQLKNLVFSKKINYIIFQDSYALIENLLWRLKKEVNGIRIIEVEHNTPDAFLKALKYKQTFSLCDWFRKIILYPYHWIKISYAVKRRHKDIYLHTDKYVLLSWNFKKIFKKVSGIKDETKLCAINNPITVKTNQTINWDNKKNICLFPARLVKQKGVGLLMEIWKCIEHKEQNWQLLIVGDGPEREYIENYIVKNNLCNVKLEGFKDNMISYYETASILLATSIYEGWLLTLGESMAYGVVPIAFDSYLAVNDIIENNNNGYLIPAFNIDTYVDKLLYLMNNNSTRKELGEQAFRSSNKYNIDSIGSQWMNFLSNFDE